MLRKQHVCLMRTKQIPSDLLLLIPLVISPDMIDIAVAAGEKQGVSCSNIIQCTNTTKVSSAHLFGVLMYTRITLPSSEKYYSFDRS